jgi:hypothetical protein
VERDDVALNEEIDALLTQATPSPQFRARVVQRIDEAEASRPSSWFALIAAVTVVALVVAAAAMFWAPAPYPEAPARSESVADAVPLEPETPAPVLETARPAAPAPVALPRMAEAPSLETVISPDDAFAFEAFVSSVHAGRVSAEMFGPSGDASPAVIEPLRLEPLASIPPLMEPEL